MEFYLYIDNMRYRAIDYKFGAIIMRDEFLVYSLFRPE